MKLIYILLLLTALQLSGFSQELKSKSDTIALITDSLPRHSPRTATLLSLAVPGLGQAYNKKYWKIPLVYAAIGAPLYFALEQQRQFNDFKQAYVKRIDNDPTTTDNKYAGVYTDQNLISLIDNTRKNRDLLFVLTGLTYALNVLDAAVDAHLYYFDVSDDLSASLKPSFQLSPNQSLVIPSLTLSLKFVKKPHRNLF